MTPAVEDLACRELVELVTDYLEDRLPAGDRTRFEQHLAGCPPCETYLRQMRQVLSAAGRLTEAAVTPEAQEALLGAFRGWKGKGRRRP